MSSYLGWIVCKKIESDDEIPLSPETNTGMLIKKIEELCQDVTTYKTNLVKCLPHKEYGS